MQAKRALLETDAQGRLLSVPSLPPDAKIEAIFLVLDPVASGTVRKPPAELGGLKILGDIVSPAIDEHDWDMTK